MSIAHPEYPYDPSDVTVAGGSLAGGGSYGQQVQANSADPFYVTSFRITVVSTGTGPITVTFPNTVDVGSSTYTMALATVTATSSGSPVLCSMADSGASEWVIQNTSGGTTYHVSLNASFVL